MQNICVHPYSDCRHVFDYGSLLDGQEHTLLRGVHFKETTLTESFRQNLYSWASKNGVEFDICMLKERVPVFMEVDLHWSVFADKYPSYGTIPGEYFQTMVMVPGKYTSKGLVVKLRKSAWPPPTIT